MATKRKYSNVNSFPILINWSINVDKLREKEFQFIATPYFNIEQIFGLQYCLKLEQKCNSNKLGINLCLTKPLHKDFLVNANVCCKTAGYVEKWTHTFGLNGYGSTLCTFTELFDPEKKFIVNNQLIISFKATLTVSNTDPIVPKLAKHESLGWKLWENEDDKDATIVVNGMEIKVHKCVLKRCSSKFQKLLHNKSESETLNESSKLVVNGHSYNTVKEAIMFCYDI
uniref:BTB domain-containing protein n=1 Tax=Panagrolaimus sp. ES5 TaxID=591445 RepID=A0AC34FKH7_9BILA